MENIRISDSVRDLDWKQVVDIFEAARWGNRGGEKFLQKAFENSQKIITAWLDKELVGFCRIVGDGVYYAAIYDLIVGPKWRKEGVGSRLLAHCEKLLASVPVVHLLALEESEAFYRKKGYARHKYCMARYLSEEKRARFLIRGPEGSL